MAEVMLDVQKLTVRYGKRLAVDGVSFHVCKGETVGLVGESGCGKSSLARAILRLQESEGRILLNGRDINAMPEKILRPLRREFQAVFQDPAGSLSPRMRVGEILAEPLRLHHPERDVKTEIPKWLKRIGLDEGFAERYPHELSGGQSQRIGIARALIAEPALVVCDEPVSALDVSIRGQILGLLESLRRDLSVSLLFIAHDMSAVQYLCDRVLVMYAGKIVEAGSREAIFSRPAHPYTRQLLEAVLPPDPDKQPPPDLDHVMDTDSVQHGCAFAPRCPRSGDICKKEIPEIREWQGREVACHFPEE